MKAFPFSLDGAAKDWLYLQPALFNIWGDMKQHTGETLHEYWKRFNKLCATCPHHQISEQLLIQYFYEGLLMMDRSMIDAASGGALMDKTSATARHLISNMASNTQQFGVRGLSPSRLVSEIGATSNQRLENQLTELTSLVRQLVVGQHQPALVTKATISARDESRAVCSSVIWIHAKCTSRTRGLSIADPAISNTTFSTTATTEIATSRQFSISGGPDEAASY
ncbi:hypothetical protein CR513_45636, partial [Mucuna pruriens]